MSLMDHARHLYIGVDFLLPRISPNISVALRDPDHDVLADYFAYLEEMRELEDDWLIIPGHDWPFYGGAPRASQLIVHHEHRLGQLLNAGGPLTTNDAMALLFPFELTDHEIYFASCEARAHLNHLVTLDKMTRSTKDGIAIFAPM
jgi:glyoxylase-like metal-dependent hydrolase (beta-lactamase superfamily II)